MKNNYTIQIFLQCYLRWKYFTPLRDPPIEKCLGKLWFIHTDSHVAMTNHGHLDAIRSWKHSYCVFLNEITYKMIKNSMIIAM